MTQIYADKNPERLRPAAGRGERLANFEVFSHELPEFSRIGLRRFHGF